jgi:hypothetical protein
MTAVSPRTFRSLEADPGEPGPSGAPRGARFALLAFILATIATVLVGVLTSLTSVRRAVHALPEVDRRELLARTADELRRYCAPGRPNGLADHCRELATFAAQFDECRGECEALVRRELTPVPTR